MAPANEAVFLDAFAYNVAKKAAYKILGIIKNQVVDPNSSASLRLGALVFTYARSSDDQYARSHLNDKSTCSTAPGPLNKYPEPFNKKTLKKQEEKLGSSQPSTSLSEDNTWTTVQRKTKGSSKSNSPTCGSSTSSKPASSTSTTSENTLWPPRPQAKLSSNKFDTSSTKGAV